MFHVNEPFQINPARTNPTRQAGAPGLKTESGAKFGYTVISMKDNAAKGVMTPKPKAPHMAGGRLDYYA